MKGSYSIAEVIDDSNKRPGKTIFCFINKDGKQEFDKEQIKSLDKVGKTSFIKRKVGCGPG